MDRDFLQLIKKYLDDLQPLQPVATGVRSEFSEPAPGVKAIIFDIYGTLIISASGDIDKNVLSAQNLKTAFGAGDFELNKELDETELLNSILEDLHREILNSHRVAKSKGSPYPEVEIIRIWQKVLDMASNNGSLKISENSNLKATAIIFELLSNPVWPMPGLKKVLGKLTDRGLPLGIISNAQFYTPIIMNYFLSDELKASENITFFEPALMVYSYKLLRAKPDTALYTDMARLLKNSYRLKAEEVLYVGNDMLKDIWPAQQVGFKTALFAGDKRSLRIREESKKMRGVKPDFIITSLQELEQMIV